MSCQYPSWSYELLSCITSKKKTNNGKSFPYLCIAVAGNISLEEFLEGACRDDWVKEFLSMEVNPNSWVESLPHVNEDEQIREA